MERRIRGRGKRVSSARTLIRLTRRGLIEIFGGWFPGSTVVRKGRKTAGNCKTKAGPGGFFTGIS